MLGYFKKFFAVGVEDKDPPSPMQTSLHQENWKEAPLLFNIALLDSLDNPLFIIAHDGEVLIVNNAARKFIPKGFKQRMNLTAILPNCLDLKPAIELCIQGKPTQTNGFDYKGLQGTQHFEYRINRLEDRLLLDFPPACIVSLTDTTRQARFSEMQKDFVANVSHELRTPLTSLIGYIDTLQGPAKEDALARNEFLSIMYDQAQRMKRLIDDLLTLSRVESKEIALKGEVFDLLALIKKLQQRLSPLAIDRDMMIRLHTNLTSAPFLGAIDQMEEVYENLIQNGLKYGKRGTPLDIYFKSQADYYHITVQDYGIGIPESSIPRLTDRFYRVDQDRSRTIGGTGLGLAIVKHILINHHGQLEISSKLDLGSSFTTLLPIINPEKT